MPDMTQYDSGADGARAKEIEAQLPVLNEHFQSYVTSTAFSMSLSRTQIRALTSVEQAILRKAEFNRLPISDGALQALARRGLIEWLPDIDKTEHFDGGNVRYWHNMCSITRPGELMLELLAEAGLVSRTALRKPLPPPPPGWLDPRPRMVLEDGGSYMAPSRREMARREAMGEV